MEGEWSMVVGRLRRDLPFALLSLLFFLLPLFRAGYLEDSFITPKVTLLFGCVLLCAISLLLSRQPGRRINSDAVTVLLLMFYAWSVAGAIYALSVPEAVHGIVYLTGFIALYLICGLMLTDIPSARFLLWVCFYAGLFTAAWTVAEDVGRVFGISPLVPKLADWRGFLAAGLGNSGHIAGFVGMTLPIGLLHFLEAKKLNYALAAAVAVMFAALVITWSIGSTGATVLSLGIWAVFLHRRKDVQLVWGRLILVVLIGLAVVLFYFLPHPFNPHSPSLWTEAFGSERWKEGGPTRVVIWKTSWEMIKSHPFLGIGTGNFRYGYVMQIVPSLTQDPKHLLYAGGFTNDAHNEYLHVWSENGLPGLITYLLIFGAALMNIRRRWRFESPEAVKLLTLSGIGLTVFALDSLMSFPLRLPSHFALFILFLSLTSTAGVGGQTTASRFTRPALLVLLGVIAVGSTIQLRRTVAEYYLKAGRALAERPEYTLQGRRAGRWSAAEGMFVEATSRFHQGNVASALDLFRQIPGAAAAPQIRAAEELFRTALKWDKNYSNAGSRLGSLLLFQGRYGDAAAVFQSTLKTLQAYEIHERLGWCYYFVGNKQSALREWEICRQRRPILDGYYSGLIKYAE